VNEDTRVYKMDGPEEIETERLLFWPNNPRLKIRDFSEVRFTDKQLLDNRNQQKVFTMLCEHEHGVRDIVSSMSKVGFRREKAPIVMAIPETQKYLVLEGNRRLTAIRLLLSDHRGSISAANRESLQEIPCWLFVHTSKLVPLAVAISRMVAEYHLKGQKPHTKIQQAHMLYDAYMGFLMEEDGGEGFSYNPDIVQKSADFFDLSLDEFRLELAVVRLYQQLTAAGYDVPHELRERLTWVYKNPRHFKNNFGYDEEDFQLDGPGLDRYHDIFVREGCAVHSPALFSKLINVMRYGEKGQIEILRSDPEQLSLFEEEILDGRNDERFRIELERIEKKLKGLRIGDYKDTPEEKRLIQSISRLVNSKLGRLGEEGDEERVNLAADAPAHETEGRKTAPDDIHQAMELDRRYLRSQIRGILKHRPNQTCVREYLPAYLLQKWGVVSRGGPRAEFVQFVEGVAVDMIAEGDLEEYRATNNRLRLL
jgi:hypothetical protein